MTVLPSPRNLGAVGDHTPDQFVELHDDLGRQDDVEAGKHRVADAHDFAVDHLGMVGKELLREFWPYKVGDVLAFEVATQAWQSRFEIISRQGRPPWMVETQSVRGHDLADGVQRLIVVHQVEGDTGGVEFAAKCRDKAVMADCQPFERGVRNLTQ